MNWQRFWSQRPDGELSFPGIAWRAVYLISLQIILLNGFWLRVLSSGPVRAMDGSTHYAAASIFNRSIYPDIFGWTNAFMGGMPLSNYYPPLLFWLTALIAHLGISFDAAFKLAALTPTLLIAPCLWLLAYRIFDKRVAFWTAFFTVLQMLIPQLNASLEWPSGLDYVSTFSIGYYAESLGFVVLVCWYLAYFGSRWSPRRHLIAGILLALVVLSSYLAVIASAVIIVTTIAFDALAAFSLKHRTLSALEQTGKQRAKQTMLHHVLNPAVGVGLSACWTVPVLATYGYVVTRPFHGVFVTTPLIVAQCIAVFGGLLAWRRATSVARPFIAVCVGLTVLILSADLAPRWFPMQGNRLAVFVRFLAAVLVGVALSRCADLVKLMFKRFTFLKAPAALRRRLPPAPFLGAALGLLLIVMLSVSPPMKFYARGGLYSGFYPGSKPQDQADRSPGATRGSKKAAGDLATTDYGAHEGQQSLQGVLEFARTHTDGRYLVAVAGSSPLVFDSLDSLAMSVYLGAQGNESTYAAYREASVNALFLYPQVAAFSSNDEPALRFGISSTLGDDLDVYNQPLKAHLDRARWLGVRYIIVCDEQMKGRFKAETNVSEAENLGRWSIFALQGQVPSFVEALHYRPALVVSDFTSKLRRSDEHSFVRLAEEQFADDWFDVPLVRCPVAQIDHMSDKALEQFGALIVETYDTDDFYQAYERLKAFSRTRPLILLPRDERLFFRISSRASEFPHLVILDSPPDDSGVFLENLWGPTRHFGHSAIREEWRQIRQVLEQNKIPVTSAEGTSGIFVALNQKSEPSFSVPSLSTGGTVPVLLRMTYHPRWKMRDGSQVYAVTPFFSLVFAGPDNGLTFRRNGVDKFGLVLSALTLVALLCGPVFVARRNRLTMKRSVVYGGVRSRQETVTESTLPR